MKTHYALLAAVALGAVIAPSAHATEKKHAKHHAPVAKESALKSEVEELRAQVSALREEINAQRATTAATQTQVATLQTQTTTAAQTATAAEATASTASAKADTVAVKVDQVQTAEATTDKKVGLMAWAGDTKVGGTVFFDYSNINQQSNGVRTPNSGTGLNVKRVYVTVDHQFNSVFSANVTMDASNVVGETTNSNFYAAANGGAAATTYSEVGKGFFVKKVYLQAKLDPALIIRAGSSDTAWIPFVEAMYGHRYVENVLIDEYKLGTSADWGVSASGQFVDGLITYQVGVVNGASYRNLQVTNAVDLDGRLALNYMGFVAGVGGYTGKLGKDIQGAAAANLPIHNAGRIDGLVGYKNDMFTIAGEYLYAKDFNGGLTSIHPDKNVGWSAFGSFNVTPKWQVFGRYDWIRQTANESTGSSIENRYFNFGLQYEPVKFVDLSLVYKRAKAEDPTNGNAGSISWQEASGSIGGSVNGTYDEIGLFGLFKF